METLDPRSWAVTHQCWSSCCRYWMSNLSLWYSTVLQNLTKPLWPPLHSERGQHFIFAGIDTYARYGFAFLSGRAVGATTPLDTLKRVLFPETGYHKTLLEIRDSYQRRYDSEHMTKGPLVLSHTTLLRSCQLTRRLRNHWKVGLRCEFGGGKPVTTETTWEVVLHTLKSLTQLCPL